MQEINIIPFFMTCAYHLQEDKHSHKGILLGGPKNFYMKSLAVMFAFCKSI